MYKKITFIVVIFGMMLTTCGSNNSRSSNSSGENSSQDPVESRKPNADYKPAFEGQTRVAGVKTKTAYEVRRITDKLNRPWGIVQLPDEKFLITEKDGAMVIAETSENAQ